MRPEPLTPLFASVQSLEGIGPKLLLLVKKALSLPGQVAEPRVIDLLWHMPAGVIDRRAQPLLSQAVPGTIATVKVRVLKHRAPPRNSKAPYTVQTEDDTARLDIVFFHADPRYVERMLPIGEVRIVSGRIEQYGEKLQMMHPDYAVAEADIASLPLLEPVYSLVAGLSGKTVLKAIRKALERVPELPEWLDPAFVAEQGAPELQGGAGGHPSAGRARRCDATEPPPGSGSLSTSCWRGNSPWVSSGRRRDR